MRAFDVAWPFVLVAMALSGCGPTDTSCSEVKTCAPHGPMGSVGHDAGAQGGLDSGRDAAHDAASTTGGAVRDAIAERARVCDVSAAPSDEPCLVSDEFAVFVAPGFTDGDGSKASPARTISAGLAAAAASSKRRKVIVCNGSYDESVTVSAPPPGIGLYGGFRCPSAANPWTYDATSRPLVRPSAGGPALHVDGAAQGFVVADFAFSAVDATSPGGSSIGAIVTDSVGVVLRRVSIVAGKGAAGQKGDDGTDGADGAEAGPSQRGIDARCVHDTFHGLVWPGGSWPGTSSCGSRGGKGGDARDTYPTSGVAGSPDTNVTPAGLTNGSSGQTTRGLFAKDAHAGSPGNPGDDGAAASALGTFSSSGYSPANGHDGSTGFPGQGGGGGGGTMPAGPDGTGILCYGATGGAGGMGGCGGNPGRGGGGGGASIALLVWDSMLTFDDGISIAAADAGNGGNGGNAGNGGTGRAGGAGGLPALSGNLSVGRGGGGGYGGNGGNGGSGSGGSGGPSFALVFHGPVPAGGVSARFGKGGAKGAGGSLKGSGTNPAPDGADGPSRATFQVM
jgi:hypothetical protein